MSQVVSAVTLFATRQRDAPAHHTWLSALATRDSKKCGTWSHVPFIRQHAPLPHSFKRSGSPVASFASHALTCPSIIFLRILKGTQHAPWRFAVRAHRTLHQIYCSIRKGKSFASGTSHKAALCNMVLLQRTTRCSLNIINYVTLPFIIFSIYSLCGSADYTSTHKVILRIY